MIYLGIGSNLPSEAFGTPLANCRAAIERLGSIGLSVSAVSRFYETAPIPRSDQPWYVNCVVGIAETPLAPRVAMAAILELEAQLGRVRTVRNAARIVDIDILAWHDAVIQEPPDLIVPHPRLTERAFVLHPLADLAPDWRHPVSGEPLADLLARLPADQEIRPINA